MIEYENLQKANSAFFEEYKKSFASTLDSGWFILGNHVKKFEEEFARYNGNTYCVGVSSGLDALMLSLRALEFTPGDEVIVPSNTYIATILSILQCSLKPVLVEPEIRTYNIDPVKIEQAITKRTKAIMVVHLYGKSCDMDPICELAQKYHLALIEDCAQSHGAKYKGKKTGTFGIGAFSFYPTKNLGALGDAGAVVTEDLQMAGMLRKLRNYGSDIKYYNEVVGFNSRLDEIQAGFLSIKLQHLDQINAHKRKLANLYLSNLKSDFILPAVDTDYFDVYHIFNIRHPKRDELRKYLLQKDIRTDIHYPVPPHKQKAMLPIIGHLEFPLSSEIHATTLSLPISFFHTEEDVYNVIEALNKF
jgi:dTDP-4-amino-4,6-dideoxygalactose transaminase